MLHFLINRPRRRPARSESGFVLFIVLVILQITTLIGLYSMMNAVLSIKKSKLDFQSKQIMLMSQYELKKMSADPHLLVAPCMLSSGQPLDLSQATPDWLAKHACSDNSNGIGYDYVIEVLDDDPCARIVNFKENDILMAAYYQITLWASVAVSPSVQFISQATLAVPVSLHGICQGSVRFITPGIQAWHAV